MSEIPDPYVALSVASNALTKYVYDITYEGSSDVVGSRHCCKVASTEPHDEGCFAVYALTKVREAIVSKVSSGAGIALDPVVAVCIHRNDLANMNSPANLTHAGRVYPPERRKKDKDYIPLYFAKSSY